MARAIDANELMVEIQVCSWDSEQDKERAEDLVLGMPTLTPPNEPLTLEELREMKGQPVWTVTTGLDGSGRWELVCDVDYEDVLEMASCVDGFYAIEMDTYGSTWTAYRRRERRTMDEYITPNYKTIGTVEQRKIRELYTSSLLNAFTQQDYLDAIALIGRVIDRLEKLEK